MNLLLVTLKSLFRNELFFNIASFFSEILEKYLDWCTNIGPIEIIDEDETRIELDSLLVVTDLCLEKADSKLMFLVAAFGLTIFPDSIGLLLCAGRYCVCEELFLDALVFFLQIADKTKSEDYEEDVEADVNLGIGICYFELKKFDTAVIYLDIAFHTCDKASHGLLSEILYYRGLTYLEQDQTFEGLQDLKNSLDTIELIEGDRSYLEGIESDIKGILF
jgi:tetratricopeptide (TPR) repeat protein